MSKDKTSLDSISDATRWHAKASGHGNAKGAAGYSSEGEVIGIFLNRTGESVVVNPRPEGFGEIKIAAAWDNIHAKKRKENFLAKLVRKISGHGVDVDIGCLYELQNGDRGAIQAFGDHFGHYKETPFIELSGDERTGDKEGDDEYIHVNGLQWPQIKRVLIYAYIYSGAENWATLRPQIRIEIPGEQPFTAVPSVSQSDLAVCVLAGMENVRNGIKISNHTEYFPGHAEMDRAFGFGIQWGDGEK